MAYNISVSDSKIIYTPLSSIDNGISYFNGTITPVRTQHFVFSTSTGSYHKTIQSFDQAKTSNIVVYHIYGTSNYATRRSTITRDITDNTAFYQMLNKYAVNDPTMIIPCDPYTSVNIIDFTDFAVYYDTNYQYADFYLKTLDKDYNVITASSYVDITVDYYCL